MSKVARLSVNSRTAVHTRNLRDWMARVDDRFMGTPLDVEPHDAILHAIRVTAGEVAYCDAQIRRLSEAELFERPVETTSAQLPSGAWTIIEERRDPEIISRWLSLRESAMDRMVRYSKVALDAGIEERKVAVAERVADVLTPLLMNLADDLHLTQAQRSRLPDVLGAHLRSLESGDDVPVAS